MLPVYEGGTLHYGYSERAVLRRVLAGTLPATKHNDRWRIGTTDDIALPDLAPADPTSPAPMDQLSVTLATMGDLLNTALPAHPASLEPPASEDRAALAAHVLTLTTVAARHTLGRMDLADAGRPLLIGRYAEHALDTLNAPTTETALADLAAFHTPATPDGPNESLETALRGWAAAARTEVTRTVPSTAVLANIASQGLHLYAVADQLTAAAVELGRLPDHAGILARRQFRSTADALAFLATGWATVTTTQQPTHTYTTAATVLHETLQDLTHQGVAR